MIVCRIDKPDNIAKDLLSAGLVEGRELVVGRLGTVKHLSAYYTVEGKVVQQIKIFKP